MKKRITLTSKALLALIIMAVVMIVFSCISIGYRYYKETEENYEKSAFAYTRAAADFIDGDTILQYIETGEKDDYYYTVLKFLRSALRESELAYYYVFVPADDMMLYIWDADETENHCDLGDYEDLPEHAKDSFIKSFSKEKNEVILISDDPDLGLIASASSPIFDSSGEPVALAAVDMKMERFTEALLRFIAAAALIILLVVIASMIVLYFVIHRSIILPIGTINNAAKNMVSDLSDNNERRIDIHTGDELEELAGSFNAMNDELRDYLVRLKKVTADKERIGAELSVATRIQADMLPNVFPPFPGRTEFDIYANMKPAREVGGDFYDLFLVDDDHLCLVMADVSGKGVPAALFMMACKIIIANNAMMNKSPAEILSDTNNAICSHNEEEMFVTVWVGILELSSGKLVAANAGHEYPVIKRPNSRFKLLKDQHGFVLGGMEDLFYVEYEIQMQPGTSLFLYTDGVLEATDKNFKLFGADRMMGALNSDPDAAPDTILENVQKAVDQFVGEAEQFDDITMMCLTYTGPEKKE